MSGLFGSALGALSGIFGDDQQGAEGRAGNLLGGALQQAGGVQGLLDRADQAGLGDHVRSWIGNGDNWPVSPAEIEKIFPPDQLDAFAAEHGVPQGAVSQVLAHLLPQTVNAATPSGAADGS